MANKKLVKDMTTQQRRTRQHKTNADSPLWRRKALSMWSEMVRLLASYECELCKAPASEVQLQAHHLLPKERYQWLMFAPINGVCLCTQCHKHSRYAAHRNPIFFAVWLKANQPEKYKWVLQHVHDEVQKSVVFQRAYNYLYARALALGWDPARKT